MTRKHKQQSPRSLVGGGGRWKENPNTYPHWYNCRRIWTASSYFLMAKEKFPFLKSWLPESFNCSDNAKGFML